MTTNPSQDGSDGLVDSSTPVDPRQQERVRSLLAGLPEPGPMPEDLVARIHARLADEALQRGTDSGTVHSLDARRRMRLMAGLAAGGSVAAAAAVVGVLLTNGSVPTGESRAVLVPSSGQQVVSVHVSDADVTAATLDRTASSLLSAGAASPLPGTAESPTLGPLATVKGLTECVAKLGITDYQHVAGQVGTYEGHPAVVLGVKNGAGALQAWVVDRSCTELTPHHAID